MLFVSLFHLPYAYYEFLRIVVCIAAAWIAYRCISERRNQTWPAVFVLIGILFNPIIPIHLGRAIWFWLDIGAAALFLAHFLIVRIFR